MSTQSQPACGLHGNHFLEAIQNRPDIFTTERETVLPKATTGALGIALLLGLYLSFVDLSVILPEFRDIHASSAVVTLKNDPVEIKKPEPVEPPKAVKNAPKKLKPQKVSKIPKSKSGNGGGSMKSLVSKKGVLGLLSQSTTGKSSTDIFGKGGTASGIDKVLRGVNGVSKGDGGPKRLGQGTFIGEGIGTSSGYGGGDNVGDVLSLIDNIGGGGESVTLKAKTKKVKIKHPGQIESKNISGKRSRADIMRVVNQNMQGLRYIYNRHLRNDPGMKGKITVKWAVDEFGNVIFCRVTDSNINNELFKKEIEKAIKRWKFKEIKIAGDVTEIIYPFVFTQ